MSKSLGNGIDPLEVIDQYGADALRFTLATGNSPGNDMRFSDDKVKASRNFANKLWNAARFVLMYLGDDYEYPGLPSELAIEDKWIISKANTLARMLRQILKNMSLESQFKSFMILFGMFSAIGILKLQRFAFKAARVLKPQRQFSFMFLPIY